MNNGEIYIWFQIYIWFKLHRPWIGCDSGSMDKRIGQGQLAKPESDYVKFLG